MEEAEQPAEEAEQPAEVALPAPETRKEAVMLVEVASSVIPAKDVGVASSVTLVVVVS